MIQKNSNASFPVQEKERIKVIDIIRGFALLGVIIVNMFTFNKPPDGHVGQYEAVGVIDNISYWMIVIFIQGKFYTLFSILFGLGFVLQINRLREKDPTYLKIYIRRLSILLIIGLIHSIFIWAGDILKVYAILGFLLLFFRNASSKKILLWGIFILASFYLVYSTGLLVDSFANKEPTEKQLEEREKLKEIKEINYETYENEGYIETVKVRMKVLTSGDMIVLILFGGLFIIPLFLFGGYLGQRKIFHDLEKNKSFFYKMFIWSLCFSVALSALYFYFGLEYKSTNLKIDKAFKLITEQLLNPALALLFISSISILYRNIRWQKILNPLSWIGQMALTNYLMQSIVFTLVFYNYGLGLIGRYSIFQLLGISIIFYIIQIIISWLWLRKFKYGPAEWLWRSLSYKKLQPMLKNK